MDEDKVFNVFISHKVDDRSIALKLQEALENLCGRDIGRLNVFVCEATPGGADWRQWITDKIADSTALIFLYTDIDADWSWCQFEVGSFIGRVEPGKKPRPVLCLKNSTISKLPSTIAGFQAYNADIKGIKKLFEELLNSNAILSERLNPDLKSSKYEERFSKFVKDIVTRFTVTTKTRFFDRLIDIILSEDADPESSELEIGDARISVDQITMSLLDLPHQNVRWKDLATSFKKRGQGKWTDQLEESVKQIENGQKPLEVLNPFKVGDGNAYIPVIARIETHQRRDEKRTITLKQLRVIFVPSPKSEAMPTLAEFFESKDMVTYTPACVLRLKWRGQSGESDSGEREYREDDLEEEMTVCAINPSCASLFDRMYEDIRQKPLKVKQLVEGVRKYVSVENMKMLEDDQEKVIRRIVFEGRNAVPRVPFQFNDAHPEDVYKNQVYLPLLIGKQVIGDVSGPHETYLLVGYIKDFLPPGESAQT